MASNLYTCTVKGRLHGQDISNVLGFSVSGTDLTAPDVPGLLAARLNTVWNARVLSVVSSSYVVVGVEARDVSDAGRIGVSAISAAGAVTAQGLPGVVVAKVRFVSLTPGRAGTGRTGLSGIGENLNDAGLGAADGNSMGAGNAASIAAAMNGLRTDMFIEQGTPPRQFQQVVLSRRFNKLPRVGLPLASPVTGASVPLGFGTRVTRMR